MNPKEFNWTEDQQVTVTNPTSETFRWKVHNKDYELAAGKTAKMPGYIAWLYVYNQAVQAAKKDGVFNRWNEEDFRPQYYEKFVVGADQLVQTIQEEPNPLQVLDDEDIDQKTPEQEAPKAAAKPGKPIKA